MNQKGTIEFSLSTENIKDIPFDMYEDEFTFHYGNKHYKTNRFIADLLSPSVRQLHYCDKTNREFYIESEKEEDEDNKYFSDFLQLYTFESKEIDYKRRTYYSKYFYLIGNIDEFIRLETENYQNINEENSIEILQKLSSTKGRLNQQYDHNNKKSASYKYIEKVINFVSSHFEDINVEKIKCLNKDIIGQIMSNDQLRIKDEDSLLEFAIEMYSVDEQNSYLFEYVAFNNVSREKIEEFVNIFSIEHLNNSIWRSICQRLVCKEKSNTERYSKNKPNEKIENITGIMEHLTRETGGNIHDNGTIEITSNSISGNYHPKNLVDYQSDNYYHSDDKEMAFICFDFKDKSINLMSYTIKSNSNSSGSCDLKSWVVEVSNDSNNWLEIDRHENDSTLKNYKKLSTIKVQKQNQGFYRFIRLRQTGFGWCRSDKYIWFYSLEFNGELKYPSK